MRYSRCIQAGRQLASLNTILHAPLLGTHLVYEFGETLYSGPSSLIKEVGNNVNFLESSATTAGLQQENKKSDDLNTYDTTCYNSANVNHDQTDAINDSDSILSLKRNERNILSLAIPVNSRDPPLLSCKNGLEEIQNNLQNGISSDTSSCNAIDSTQLKENNSNLHLEIVCNSEKNNTNATDRCTGTKLDELKVELISTIPSKKCESKGEMVRLIQDPISKLDHCLRKGIRGPKRIQSVDSLDLCSDKSDLRKNKLSKKGAVRARCQSERSDSEISDDLHKENILQSEMVDKLVKCRKPKNGEALNDEHNIVGCNSGEKLNGDICVQTVNGLDKLKARRVSRTNSDDSDSVLSAKVNGIDIDNDRVDINLLLEISAKDRKRFENKKAKIKRKTADWMLITETEHYYNEKEEILRNKLREDSESDSDFSDSDKKSPSKLALEEKSKEIPEKNKCTKKSIIDSKQLQEHTGNDKSKVIKKGTGSCKPLPKKKSHKKITCDVYDHKVEESERSSRSKSRLCPKDSTQFQISVSDFSNDEGDSSYNNEEDHIVQSLKHKVGKMSNNKTVEKSKKRLSDAERFLRDNKEYYQFPETRDRLRRNVSYGLDNETVEAPELTHNNSCDSDLETSELSKQKKETSVPNPENITSSPKLRKGKNNLPSKVELCELQETEKKDIVLRPISEPQKVIEAVNVPPKDEGETGDKVVDGLYFSFEGAPVRESWYQTYQRYIDGAEVENFEYERDSLRFILPYEMPKEYFKELHAKRNLMARKKIDLAELVRKSPRCHASTLALFSDLFPSKKKKSKVNKVIKTEDVSSDGTSTPIQEVAKLPVADLFEAEEEIMFIGHCMDQVMKSTINESCDVGDSMGRKVSKETKKGSKKKCKGKKMPASMKINKFEFPIEAKIFDNYLATEIDACFLQSLPQYLEEVSVVPNDTSDRNSVELMTDSCHCDCTEKTSCDELSSADERTEVSSESLSVCDSEIIDSSNSGFPSQFRKFGPYKKRKKNMTGWPKQKRKKPTVIHISDDNDSALGFDDREPKKRFARKVDHLMPCSNELSELGNDRRASARIKSSVLYLDSWPLRFRNNK